MKQINFINPIPPERKREVRLWGWISVIAWSSIIITLGIITGMQWHDYRLLAQERHELQQQVGSFSITIEQQKKQTEQKEQLQQKLKKCSTCKTNPKSPTELITIVRTALGTIPIQAITISKCCFELHTLCTNAQQAHHCLQKLLQERSIRMVQLASLQTQQKQCVAVFKGEITR